MITLGDFDTFSRRMNTALNLIEELGDSHEATSVLPLSWRIEYWLQNAGTTLLRILSPRYTDWTGMR